MREKSYKTEFRIDVGMKLIWTEPEAPRSLAVLLHGMGQNGSVIEAKLAPALGTARALLVPDGPLPFEQVVDGRRRIGHAWYLYTGDQEAFLASARRTADWLEQEIDAALETLGMPAGAPVHLVGYSQGGYLAGLMTLERPERYASLVSICSRIKAEVLAADADVAALPPIQVLHGERDRFLPLEKARESAEILLSRGARVDLRIFGSGHGLSPEQAAAAAEFLDRCDLSY